MNAINSWLRKMLPRLFMFEAKRVTKRISLILLVKLSEEGVILVNNKHTPPISKQITTFYYLFHYLLCTSYGRESKTIFQYNFSVSLQELAWKERQVLYAECGNLTPWAWDPLKSIKSYAFTLRPSYLTHFRFLIETVYFEIVNCCCS